MIKNILKFIGLLILFIISCIIFVFLLSSCNANCLAQMQQASEYRTAQFRSEYAIVRPKLNMNESNFKEYRKVVFYNVRLGETVFACIGYTHIQIDEDGDIELVIKTENGKYLRHYLGPKQDITYFSEQLEPTDADKYKYKIFWNPRLWVPKLEIQN